MDSLSILTSDIKLAFTHNDSVVSIFLDITSAYDNVKLPLLKKKMLELSIPDRLTHFIFNLLTARSVAVRHNGITSDYHNVWKGLPQGSVLSPILYNIYTYDLDQTVNSFCQCLQYADDIALYYRCKNTAEASAPLNSALFYLNNWLIEHGLSLSAPKSKAIVFTRKRDTPTCNLHIEDQPIQFVESVKFLGLYLDTKMSGSVHLDYISKKCEKNINVLRCLSGVWWGAHPYSQKNLYNSIIRSHLDYATFLLEPCSKLSLNKINKIQNKSLRIVIGAMKSSSIPSLQIECADPPLNLRRQHLSDRFYFKAAQNTNHRLHSILHP